MTTPRSRSRRAPTRERPGRASDRGRVEPSSARTFRRAFVRPVTGRRRALGRRRGRRGSARRRTVAGCAGKSRARCCCSRITESPGSRREHRPAARQGTGNASGGDEGADDPHSADWLAQARSHHEFPARRRRPSRTETCDRLGRGAPEGLSRPGRSGRPYRRYRRTCRRRCRRCSPRSPASTSGACRTARRPGRGTGGAGNQGWRVTNGNDASPTGKARPTPARRSAHVPPCRPVAALVGGFRVDDQALRPGPHGGDRRRRLGGRVAPVDELPRAHVQAVRTEIADDRRTVLAQERRAIRGLDEHRAHARRARLRRDRARGSARRSGQVEDPDGSAFDRLRRPADRHGGERGTSDRHAGEQRGCDQHDARTVHRPGVPPRRAPRQRARRVAPGRARLRDPSGTAEPTRSSAPPWSPRERRMTGTRQARAQARRCR